MWKRESWLLSLKQVEVTHVNSPVIEHAPAIGSLPDGSVVPNLMDTNDETGMLYWLATTTNNGFSLVSLDLDTLEIQTTTLSGYLGTISGVYLIPNN